MYKIQIFNWVMFFSCDFKIEFVNHVIYEIYRCFFEITLILKSCKLGDFIIY